MAGMHRAVGTSWRAAQRWRRAHPRALATRALCAARFSTTGAVAATPPAKTAQVATESCLSLARGDRTSVAPAEGSRLVLLSLLESNVADKKPAQALACFDQLQTQSPLMPEAPQLLQKLVLLVAKRGERDEIPRAAQIMRTLLVMPTLEPDDYTQLAAIYVLTACLRVGRLSEALEIFEAAQAADVLLDVPAYEALLSALVDAEHIEKAASIVKGVVADDSVKLAESAIAPVLLGLMLRSQYEDVIELIELGRDNGVAFTMEETYDTLVTVSEMQSVAMAEDDSCDENLKKVGKLGELMEYINRAVKQDQLIAALNDIVDDEEEDDDDSDDDDLDEDDFDDDD